MRTFQLFAAIALILSAQRPVLSQGTEEAGSTISPWSGWWWPAKAGDQVLGYRNEPGPLVKLDQLSGSHSVTWERANPNHYNPNAGDWWGHCHAWAAASVLEPEPL